MQSGSWLYNGTVGSIYDVHTDRFTLVNVSVCVGAYHINHITHPAIIVPVEFGSGAQCVAMPPRAGGHRAANKNKHAF